MTVEGVYTLRPIARLRCDLPTKFGVPRQSGLVKGLEGEIIFEPPYRDRNALRGIEEYTHLWLIWQFSHVVREGKDGENWSPTVRPPRLGGNTRVGVFATRSPYRPNALGLSCVSLLGLREDEVFGTVLRVGGADLLDGTPIYDIKPYLPYVESHPEAFGSFSDTAAGYSLEAVIPPELEALISPEKREALMGILSGDPRPAYHDDPEREYGFPFAGCEVSFKVKGKVLTVTDIKRI